MLYPKATQKTFLFLLFFLQGLCYNQYCIAICKQRRARLCQRRRNRAARAPKLNIPGRGIGHAPLRRLSSLPARPRPTASGGKLLAAAGKCAVAAAVPPFGHGSGYPGAVRHHHADPAQKCERRDRTRSPGGNGHHPTGGPAALRGHQQQRYQRHRADSQLGHSRPAAAKRRYRLHLHRHTAKICAVGRVWPREHQLVCRCRFPG